MSPAQHNTKKEYPTYIDLAGSMEVSQKTAADDCVYKGKVNCFCSPTYRETIEAEPEKFKPRHRQHGYPRS